ncbi:hypothetical protein AB0K74_42200, partial [Streptomyces sp. NPDC056159]
HNAPPPTRQAESAYRQVKTFQRGSAQVLRSTAPALVRQEVWAHLVVHHCLNRIIMRVAGGERIDPDRISFVKVLKHVRRSVVKQAKDAAWRCWRPRSIASSTAVPAADVLHHGP